MSARRGEELVLGFVVMIAASVLPRWEVLEQAWVKNFGGVKWLPWPWYVTLLFLALALTLTLPTARRSGLHVGDIGTHWRRVLLVCGGAVVATATVYPVLPTRPWEGQSITMWLVSPVAQQLIFFGYLFGRLEEAFPSRPVHAYLPFSQPLLLTCGFFALWHLPNAFSLPLGYFVFQLFYTGLLSAVPGLARQWTGSVYYGILTHIAVNFLAWRLS